MAYIKDLPLRHKNIDYRTVNTPELLRAAEGFGRTVKTLVQMALLFAGSYPDLDEVEENSIATEARAAFHVAAFALARIETPPETADVIIENHGSVFLFRARTDDGRAWLKEHTDGTWLGDGLGVEPRFAADLVEGLEEAGLAVR